MTVRTADVFVSTLSPYHLTVILEYLYNCFSIAEVVMVLTYWIIVNVTVITVVKSNILWINYIVIHELQITSVSYKEYDINKYICTCFDCNLVLLQCVLLYTHNIL